MSSKFEREVKRLAVLAAVLLSLAACSEDDTVRRTADALDALDTGPLALTNSTGSGDAGLQGELVITEQCVILQAGTEEVTLSWRADQARWSDGEIVFRDPREGVVRLEHGDRVQLGGGSDAEAESGRTDEDWITSEHWVVPPDPSCVRKHRFDVGSASTQ